MLGIIFVALSIPAIVLIIIFTTKARNKANFEKQYGCSPEAYEELKKQKALFDQGIITIEQFEFAKMQILNKK